MDEVTCVEKFIAVVDHTHQIRQTLTAQTRTTAGLTVPQAVALCHLERGGGHLTITELATAVSRANHTVTALVDVLEKRGLAKRRRDHGLDRRVVWVQITPAGLARLRAYRDGAATIIQPLLADGTSIEELGAYLDRLLQLLARLSQR